MYVSTLHSNMLLEMLYRLQFLYDRILTNIFFFNHTISMIYIWLRHFIIFQTKRGHENIITTKRAGR
jgi:hypothetical protein